MVDQVFDVVVIGAGVMGSSVAHHATRHGAKVAIVEGEFSGRATTAGAGIISAFGLDPAEADPDWLSLVEASAAGYEEMLRSLGETAAAESDYARVGEVVVARTEEERAGLIDLERRVSTRFRERGIDARPAALTGDQLREFWPQADAGLTALHIPGTGRVDGNKLAAVLLADAVANGAARIGGRAGFRVANGKWHVTVDGVEVVGANVVIACGIWAHPMLQQTGATVGVFPDRGQIVHLATPAHDTSRYPVLKTFDGPYLLGFPGNRVVAGATHGLVDELDLAVNAGAQLEVLRNALDVAPGLAAATIIETRVGFRPSSSDGLPIVGQTDVGGAFAGSGLGSWGLTLAPLLGDVLARQVLGLPAVHDGGFLSPLRAPRATR